jgi:hypothetical protein
LNKSSPFLVTSNIYEPRINVIMDMEEQTLQKELSMQANKEYKLAKEN